MQKFLEELPALIITLAVLAMATILLLLGHISVGDATTIVSPVIAFWFIGGAFKWQPTASPLQGGTAQQEKAS
jgi:hypothetical protein